MGELERRRFAVFLVYPHQGRKRRQIDSKAKERSNFRFAPGYAVRSLETALDWSAWNVKRDALTGQETAPGTGLDPSGGLASAVEMCNNNGHCRKFDAGTMCPSYRITKDERHVTRGRANTLRLVLSSQLGETGLVSDEVKEVLDLCAGPGAGAALNARLTTLGEHGMDRVQVILLFIQVIETGAFSKAALGPQVELSQASASNSTLLNRE
jgi:hypothetical protein